MNTSFIPYPRQVYITTIKVFTTDNHPGHYKRNCLLFVSKFLCESYTIEKTNDFKFTDRVGGVKRNELNLDLTRK